MRYLMIENQGVCPPEGITILGASSKDTPSDKTIGQFGSGVKYSIPLLMRHRLTPTIFCGKHSLSFSAKSVSMDALEGVKSFDRIMVKHGGIMPNGVCPHKSEALPIVTSYGEQDWDTPLMGVREFVSNAFDAADTMGLPQSSVVVEGYEGTPEGRDNTTRVFIPLQGEISGFLAKRGDYFLQFSGRDGETLLDKSDNSPAKIYRRGVFVRSIDSKSARETNSIFDYNLDVKIDEARKLDDYSVKSAAAKALAKSPSDKIAKVLKSLVKGVACWESNFTRWDLDRDCGTDKYEYVTRWSDAIIASLPPNGVFSSEGLAPYVTDAGFHPIIVSEGWYEQIRAVKPDATADGVLSDDDKNGRKVTPPTEAMVKATQWAYNLVTGFDCMAEYKGCPPCNSFTEKQRGEKIKVGYYQGGQIYYNEEVHGNKPHNDSKLLQTALHEMAHHISEQCDNTRGFEDWLISLLVKIAK